MPQVSSRAQARFLLALSERGGASKEKVLADIRRKGGFKKLPRRVGRSKKLPRGSAARAAREARERMRQLGG